MANNKLELIALHHGSYFITGIRNHLRFEYPLSFEGANVLPCYKEGWVHLDALPTAIKYTRPGATRINGYVLKQEYWHLPLEKEVDAEFFEIIDEDDLSIKNGELHGLYSASYIREPDTVVYLEFELTVLELDVDPYVPKYGGIKSKFPYQLSIPVPIRFVYPCYMDPADVVENIRQIIKPLIKPTQELHPPYGGANYIRVTEKVPVLFADTVTVSFMKGKKIVEEIRPLRSLTTPLIDLKVSRIEANSYQELDQEIDRMIEEIKEKISQSYVVCEHCRGYGFTKSPQ